MYAYSTLGTQGISNPQGLAHSVSFMLISSATGFFIFPVGVIVLIISVIRYRRSDRRPVQTSPGVTDGTMLR